MKGKVILAALAVVATAGCGSGPPSFAKQRAEVARCLQDAGWTVNSSDQTPKLIVASSGKMSLTIYTKKSKPPSDWMAAWTSYGPPDQNEGRTLRHCLR